MLFSTILIELEYPFLYHKHNEREKLIFSANLVQNQSHHQLNTVHDFIFSCRPCNRFLVLDTFEIANDSNYENVSSCMY